MRRATSVILLGIGLVVCTACVKLGYGNDSGNVPSVCNQQSGVSYVGMARQDSSAIYNTGDGFADPLAFCKIKGAIITHVSNKSPHNYTLAHVVSGSPFIILRSGTSADVWNGQRIEGNYTAQYSGNLVSAPSSLAVTVEWRRP